MSLPASNATGSKGAHMRAPVSVKETLLSLEPCPCDPAAETAIQLRFGVLKADFPACLLIWRSVFVHRHQYHARACARAC